MIPNYTSIKRLLVDYLDANILGIILLTVSLQWQSMKMRVSHDSQIF